jgi:glycogen synthase
MKVVSIGGDESVLVEGSPSSRRMRAYADHLEELHIVVAARAGQGLRRDGSLTVYAASAPGRLGRRLKALGVAAEVCRAALPDVITTQNADDFGLIGWRLSRMFGVPLQVQVHTDVLSPHYRNASWKERVRYLCARFVLPKADCIRVVSRRVAESITRELRIPADRVTVLPIQTDVSSFRTAPRDPATDERFGGHPFRVVSVGRMVDREKNFSLLIDTVGDLKAGRARALLVIVGDGPDRERLQRHVRARGLEDVVVLERWRDDLPSFLKSFDLFVLPSTFEGWGRVCIEAMAAGLPVVMTDVGLAGEVVRDGATGVVVPVGDRAAMTNAIRDLYSDAERRRRLALAGQAAIESVGLTTMEDYYRAYCASFERCAQR